MHIKSFPHSHSATTHIFELIHVDTWGTFNQTSHNGYKYFLTIVDDYSRDT